LAQGTRSTVTRSRTRWSTTTQCRAPTSRPPRKTSGSTVTHTDHPTRPGGRMRMGFGNSNGHPVTRGRKRDSHLTKESTQKNTPFDKFTFLVTAYTHRPLVTGITPSGFTEVRLGLVTTLYLVTVTARCGASWQSHLKILPKKTL